MAKMNSNKKNSYHIEREYFELKATIDKNALINILNGREFHDMEWHERTVSKENKWARKMKAHLHELLILE